MVKGLIKRLKNDIVFKLDCGFLISDTIPSEASYSRLITNLAASNILEKALENIVLQAIEKGVITDESVAIDATHFEAQLDTPLDELRSKIPLDPQWGVGGEKNSEGKNVFWYGYKGHLTVGTSSQYILQATFSSGNLNDGKMAIPLLKGIFQK